MGFDVVVAPPTLYYAQADGTNFKDSAVLGAKLEKQTAFKNLISEFIKPKSGTPGRLECAKRPWFPLWRVNQKSEPDDKGIAVVAPSGLNGGPADENDDIGEFADEAQRDEASAFFNTWFFEPAVTIDSSGEATLGVGAGTVHRAHLVIMSSHGWLGGFAGGELWNQKKWYLAGKVAEDGRGFKGPVWVILTQCSTLCGATWPSWVKILQNSSPHVRGILGYEEVAPGAKAAAAINENFVASLKAGKSFLEAWKANNKGNNWAAIVHKDALGDKLKDLPDIVQNKKKLASVATTATSASYNGYLKNVKSGAAQEIFLESPPFKLKLFSKLAGSMFEVKPSTLDSQRASLLTYESKPPTNHPPAEYHLEVTAPSEMTSVTIEWIHIRPSKPRLNMSKIFKPATATTTAPGATITTSTKGTKKELTQVDVSAGTSCKVVFPAQPPDVMRTIDGHGDNALEAHHSYLYPRVTVKLKAGGELKFDFATTGISYYGV
jgi:hypothetical protein